MKKFILYCTGIVWGTCLFFSPYTLSAQGKSIKRIEAQEKEAYQLYQQKDYQEACKLYIQTTQQRANVQISKINLELFIIFLLIVVGFFLYLLLEKQRAYKKLVSKNIQCAERPLILGSITTFDTPTPADPKDELIFQQLQTLFEQEHVFLNQDLTLVELSRQLGTNKTTLSRIINSSLHKNFPTILNEYRINEAVKLLTDKKNNRYKMEVISEMCGYHNRQAFHAAFKKETGLTPNDFRKMAQEKDINED